MKSGILVAHPLKHHAFHLAAGCQRAGGQVRLLTPLYRKGLGELLSRFPGSIGRKATGYICDRLDARSVEAPLGWQMQRLLSLNGDIDGFVRRYDKFVANKLVSGEFKPKVLVTLQDYLPLTVSAAKRQGCVIWSDQISNQSTEALSRVAAHHAAYGSALKDDVQQISNRKILSLADVVTVPSTYALSGVAALLSTNCVSHVVPYGAEVATEKKITRRDEEIIVVARANSVRKGGPAFFEALSRSGTDLLALAGGERLEVRVVGNLDEATARVVSKASFHGRIKVSARAVPHSDMPRFLSDADLFVMPALSESMSLMCIEAMCAGLPCVITSYCGIDIFRDGESGIEIGDTSDAIEKGLRTAFANRSSWGDWGENARGAAVASSWTEYEKRVAEIAADLS